MKSPRPIPREQILERLERLYLKLDEEGWHVHANTVAVAIDEIKGGELFRERLQAIVDWADLALSRPDEFNSHGVKNLDGPIFDEARALLKEGEN